MAARRVITAVFVDLSGYTHLCSVMDVEDVHLLVRPVMNALRAAFEAEGAVVPGIEGDGFMAVFGAVTSQDDDPTRAVHAAVAAQRVMRQRQAAVPDALPSLRIGIAMGEALVVPSSEPAGFSVTGDCVNVASRLCAIADEGGVLATHDVALAVPGAAWSPPSTRSLRKRAEPLVTQALDVAAVDAPLQAYAQRTSYVARPDVDDIVDTALLSGGDVVLVGDAGMGKTRLVDEALARAASLPLGPVVRAVSPCFHGQSLLQQLAAQVAAVDLPPLVERRVRRAAGEAVDTTESDAEDDLVAAAVQGLRGMHAGVVVVDDHQWANEKERALVGALLADRGSLRAVLVASRDPVGFGGSPLQLTQLGEAEAQALIRSLLPLAPEQLVGDLYRRCGGVPLFLEQCVRLLIEQDIIRVGAEETVILRPDRLDVLPTFMRLFIASRIDALDAADSVVIGAAAVIGDIIDVDLLRVLTKLGDEVGPVIDRLVDRRMLVWSRQPGGQLVLTFQHALVRDVAYEGLLRAARLEMHRAAAEWYAVLPVATQLEDEARHLEAAVRLGEPDCELVRRTVFVHGTFALAVVEERPSAAEHAIELATTLLERHPECQADALNVLLARAQLGVKRGEEASALVAARAAAAHASSDKRLAELALAHVLEARAHGYGEPDEADQAFARAERLYAELGDDAGVARVVVERGRMDTSRGMAVRIETNSHAWRVAQRYGDQRLASQTAQDLAMHVPNLDLPESLRWLGRAEEALRGDDVVGRLRLQFTQGLVARLRGLWGLAATTLTDVLRQARAVGDLHLLANASFIAAECLVHEGRLSEAAEVMDLLGEISDGRPTRRFGVDTLMHQALLIARRGDPSTALAMLDEALVASQELATDYVRQAHAFRGRVLADAGHFAGAETELRRALALDDDLEQPVLGMTARVELLAARTAARGRAPLREERALRDLLRESEATGLDGLAQRWLQQDELLSGHVTALVDPVSRPEGAAARALDAENAALRGEDPQLLLVAAQHWAELGTTVWEARALLWHESMTGSAHPEAGERLAQLGSPPGLADVFRGQVRRS